MEFNGYKCDGCGVVKGESNHWWIVTTKAQNVTVSPWSDKRARIRGAQHICGQACRDKAVGRALEKAAAPAAPTEQAK